MNKKHWNTVMIDGSVSDKLVKQWIDDSYKLVVSKLTKKQKEKLSVHLA
jgi:predicted DNA-binding protein (MmcQ/YjbR family)